MHSLTSWESWSCEEEERPTSGLALAPSGPMAGAAEAKATSQRLWVSRMGVGAHAPRPLSAVFPGAELD